MTDMERDQPVNRNYIHTGIDTPVADDSAISFETQINYFRQSDNRVLALLTVQTDNDELQFTNSGGLETARLNILERSNLLPIVASGSLKTRSLRQLLPKN